MELVHVSTKSKQDYGTPPALVAAVARQFGCVFTVDLAASWENRKVGKYITRHQDSLAVDWAPEIGKGEGWLNPPFSGAERWMEKCRLEAERGCRIVSLTLASLGTGWYRRQVEGRALSLVLRRRVWFVGQEAPFPKELMISLWGFGLTGLAFWDPGEDAVR